ncbi:MAG: family 10 glycosylhydrolase, partial [Fidelibacterota bacterium]
MKLLKTENSSYISIIFIPLFFILIYSLIHNLSLGGIESRYIWVTRWEYSTEEDVKRIIENASTHNFNNILFQVRGNGTVFYPSKLEPWAEEFNWENPGWDPLSTAIREAHRRGLKLHAWINVFPGWRGVEKPKVDSQLLISNPGWFMEDINGNKMPLNYHYVWLSPTIPQVRNYLFQIVSEILENYNVDGIHFDYIRYPGFGYSYDSTSVALFKQKYGSDPFDLPDEWDQFRRDAITQFVQMVYEHLIKPGKNVILSAAVFSDYTAARNLFFQDSQLWLEKGIIDLVFPMIYTSSITNFQNLLENYLTNGFKRYILPGIRIDADLKGLEQILITRLKNTGGLAIFSYGRIFPDHRAGLIAWELKEKLFNRKSFEIKLPWKFKAEAEVPATFISTSMKADNSKIAKESIKKDTSWDEKEAIIYKPMEYLGTGIPGAQFIEIDKKGRLWIPSWWDNEIKILNPDGKEASFSPLKYGLTAAGDTIKFRNPAGISIDNAGRVYISGNPGSKLIFIFSGNGKPLTSIKTEGMPGEIDADSKGYIYFNEISGSYWYLLNSEKNVVMRFSDGDEHMYRGIAVQESGETVYLPCQLHEGVHLWIIKDIKGEPDYQPSGMIRINGFHSGTVDVDGQGNLFVSVTSNNSVIIYDPHGNILDTLHSTKPKLRGPRGVGFNSDSSEIYIVQSAG